MADLSINSYIGNVFKSPEHRFDDLTETARTLDVATIGAVLPEPDRRSRIIPASEIPRVVGSGTVAGYAVTVWQAPGNNTMVRYGILSAGAGDLLLMVCPTLQNAAQWGEMASTWARARSIEGVIVDGAVRDVDRAREIGVPLWGRTIDPRQAYKSELGYVNAPVQLSGITVNPGDLVVADSDGIIVLDPDTAPAAMKLAMRRAERENSDRAERARGEWSEPQWDESQIRQIEQTWDEYVLAQK